MDLTISSLINSGAGFPGINAVKQALDKGVKITGCTVHIVELKVDSGPIIIQAAVPILEGDTEKKLLDRIQLQEHFILPKAIAILVSMFDNIAT